MGGEDQLASVVGLGHMSANLGEQRSRREHDTEGDETNLEQPRRGVVAEEIGLVPRKQRTPDQCDPDREHPTGPFRRR